MSEETAPQIQVDLCLIVMDRYKNAVLWKDLWSILVFVLGSFAAVFLVAAIILLFTQPSPVPGAISILGTIVPGITTNWIVQRRSEAVKEMERA